METTSTVDGDPEISREEWLPNTLWKRYQETGDRDVFRSLYDGCREELSLYFKRHGVEMNTAEDLLQQTFTNVFRAAGSFRLGAAFRPWLYRIARNAMINEQRTAAAHRTIPLGGAAENMSNHERLAVLDALVAEEERAQMYQAMQQLPTTDQQVLEGYIDQERLAQIAERLKLSEKYVRVIVCRAKRELAELCQSSTRDVA